MVAPTLTSDQPGLEVLAEVARILAAGPPAEDGLGSVLAVLRRGLALRRCRLWLRTPAGSRYTPLSPASDEPEPRDAAADVAAWIAKGPDRAPVAGGTLYRLPLVYEDEPLGCLEAVIHQGTSERVSHDILVVVVQWLARPRACLEKRGLVGGAARGKSQEGERDPRGRGGPRHNRITKIPMRLD